MHKCSHRGEYDLCEWTDIDGESPLCAFCAEKLADDDDEREVEEP